MLFTCSNPTAETPETRHKNCAKPTIKTKEQCQIVDSKQANAH